jgi:plasmid stabilization system protein ParE
MRKANAIVAQNLIIGIIDTSIRLSKNPKIGQIEDLLVNRPQKFRYLIYKNYKIIYWVDYNKNRIEVVNVFDTRQNPVKMDVF